jgi:hypothetical protein
VVQAELLPLQEATVVDLTKVAVVVAELCLVLGALAVVLTAAARVVVPDQLGLV